MTGAVYQQSASVYDAIYAELPDYAADVELVHQLIQARRPGSSSLLDVACGTGRHLELLRGRYDVAGLDASEQMLAIARTRLPGVPLYRADMAEFQLGRTFHAVTCLFSSIGYVRTVDRLRMAAERFAAHLQPGGVLIVEPWLTPDVFEAGRVSVDVCTSHERRKVARMIVGRRRGDLSTLESRLLIGTPDGIEEIAERHELGLFTIGQYAQAFESAGIALQHDPNGLTANRGLLIGVKSA